MSDSGSGSIPWPVYAVVSILVAVIGAYAVVRAGDNGGDPPPEPPPTDFSERVGVYTGQTTNKTFNVSGVGRLDLKNIESPNGDVEAAINWSQGLVGDANLSGQIDETGVMKLSGDIYSATDETRTNFLIFDGELDCKFASKTYIRCTYELQPRPGNPVGTQNGEMSLTYSSP